MSTYNREDLAQTVVEAATALSADPIGRVLVQMSAERGVTFRAMVQEFERSNDMRQTVVMRLAHASLLNLEHQMAVQVSSGQPAVASLATRPDKAASVPEAREPGPDPVRASGATWAGKAGQKEACPGCGRSRVMGGPWAPPGGVWALPALFGLCAVMATLPLPSWAVVVGAVLGGAFAMIVWRALTLRPCARCGTD